MGSWVHVINEPFLYQYQNARATFVCVVVCLKVDLTHLLLIWRTFNSDNFLRASYIKPSTHVSESTFRVLLLVISSPHQWPTKELAGTVGNIPQVLQHPYQRWMTTLRSHGYKLIACNKTVGSEKTYTAKSWQLPQTSTVVYFFIITFV